MLIHRLTTRAINRFVPATRRVVSTLASFIGRDVSNLGLCMGSGDCSEATPAAVAWIVGWHIGVHPWIWLGKKLDGRGPVIMMRTFHPMQFGAMATLLYFLARVPALALQAVLIVAASAVPVWLGGAAVMLAMMTTTAIAVTAAVVVGAVCAPFEWAWRGLQAIVTRRAPAQPVMVQAMDAGVSQEMVQGLIQQYTIQHAQIQRILRVTDKLADEQREMEEKGLPRNGPGEHKRNSSLVSAGSYRANQGERAASAKDKPGLGQRLKDIMRPGRRSAGP